MEDPSEDSRRPEVLSEGRPGPELSEDLRAGMKELTQVEAGSRRPVADLR